MDPLLLLTLGIALAVTLVVWAGVDLGSNALQLYRKTFTERADFNLRNLFLFLDPTRLYVVNIGVMLLALVLVWAFTGSVFLGLITAGGLAFLPWWLFRFMRQRRLDKIEEQLPDALLVLAGGLKAGVSLTVGIQQLVRETPAPISQEFDLVLREQKLGVSLDEAFENLARRIPTQSIILVISAMRIATGTGGNLSETLERASQTVRSKLAMEGKIRALTSQGKLQALVVGALPLLMMYVLTRMEPEAMSRLWTTRMGIATLIVIGLLEVFGIVLIRKIVAIEV